MRLASAILAVGLVYATGSHFGDSPLGVPTAAASTFVELTVADLVSGSMYVVCGTPQDRMSVWEDSDGARGRRIVSYTRVRVDQVVDGAPAAEIWVRTLGGTVGDLGQRVEGEAVLAPGQPALMFLAARQDGTHSVVGMSQGHFPLEAAVGEPMKVSASRVSARLVPRLGNAPLVAPARLDLPGRTVDEVRTLVASLRHANVTH
ncbi:MAG TPA: hypothetical protein VGL13_05470 [Polyangiaceae bacterium]